MAREKNLQDTTLKEPVDFTLDESKLILRGIAQELDRILQMLHGQTAALSPCSNGQEENRGEACTPKPEEDKRLKKAIAEVRLDPSTANPYLKISPDGRAVKMDQIVEGAYDPWEGFRRTRHRYDGWWCVLGREGFASGKHYWEMDVRGKMEWRVGVVRESAPRNGFKSLNPKTYHWTLKLQFGRLMAMTVEVTKLASCAPSVLGVFLDMEEGNVSFYDVRNTFYIYSFNVSFNLDEKIFPVFGTVETRREMRILN
ncbi:unnamed protein product [Arctogadus glacialis]